MAPPPFPPKPKIGPLVRRSLFAAALGAAGCSQPAPVRIGAVRIGQPPPDEYYAPPADAAPEPVQQPPADAGFAKPPPGADAAAAVVQPAADAAATPVKYKKEPIRIGMYRPPIRIGPPKREVDFEKKPRGSSLIQGRVLDSHGEALAFESLRVELPSGVRIVATDATGAFSIDGLPPGNYAATIVATGYAPAKVQLNATRKSKVSTVSLEPSGC